MIFELARDFADALAAMPAERPKHRMLELFEEAIRRDIHFIARHPTTLFQCMWNTCWWYDCPEAADHYEMPEGGWPETPPWDQPGPKLCALMQRWRGAKEDAILRFRWLGSLRPPLTHLGTGEQMVLRGHANPVVCVACSPDGSLIASGDGKHESTVRVWDAGSGQERRCISDYQGWILGLSFSADGRFLAAATENHPARDYPVVVLDVGSGTQVQCFRGHESAASAVDYALNGRLVVSSSSDRTIRVWDAQTGSLRLRLSGHDDFVNDVAFARDGSRIVSGSHDGTVRVWDAETGEQLLCLRGHDGAVKAIAYSPDGLRIASGSEDRTVRVWDGETGEQLLCLRGHDGAVKAIAYSPDGSRIVSAGGWDRTVRVWDAETAEQLRCLRGHQGVVTDVAYCPDGVRVVSGSADATVRVWHTERGEESRQLHGHTDTILTLSYSLDGKRLVTGSRDQTLRLWDAERGRQTLCVPGHEGDINAVAYSPRGSTVASGSDDRTVRVWRVQDGRELASFRGHEYAVAGVAYSPDGRYLVSLGALTDHTIRVWDTKTRAPVRCIGRPVAANAPHTVRFSPDGRRIIAVSRSAAWLWDAATGSAISTCSPKGSFPEVIFSPDGRWVVAESWHNTVRVWSMETERQLLCMYGHEDTVRDVSCSRDGELIASASDDGTVRVWDAKSGGQLRCLRTQGRARCVAFSPCDGRIVAVDCCGVVRCKYGVVWDDCSLAPSLRFIMGLGSGGCIAWAPDGRRLAGLATEGSIGESDQIMVWDGRTGEEVLSLFGHEGRVTSVAYSPDGLLIGSGSDDMIVRVWGAASGAEPRRLCGHSGSVRSVAWSPEGSSIASGSDDATIRIWNLVEGRESLCLRSDSGPQSSVAYSPDGRYIASGGKTERGGAHAVCVWSLQSGEQVAGLHCQDTRVSSLTFSCDGQRIVAGCSDRIPEVWNTTTGEYFEGQHVIRGIPLSVLSAGKLPFRALARKLETVFEDVDTGEPIGWFGTVLEDAATCLGARSWAGASGSHLHIIRIEGGKGP